MGIGLALRLLVRAAKYRWKLDAPEIDRMLGCIGHDGHAIDVGAHKGAYTFWMARKVGTAGEVLAIEPQANLCRDLRESLHSFGLDQARVIEAALSSKTGTSLLHVPTNASTQSATLAQSGAKDGFRHIEVKTTTIDSLVESRGWKDFGFMKVDAEGHEIAILRGAARSLARFKPTLLVEAEARKHGGGASHVEQLTAMLSEHGYKGTFNDGTRWRPVSELEVERHQNFGHGKFCNNIFYEAV